MRNGIVQMRPPPFRCLFCSSERGPFESVEHPIPESMGNDDTVVPKGFVCDACNQYFGSKIERQIMASPPFNVERVKASIKTKKHGYSKYVDDDLLLLSHGFWDHTICAMSPERYNSIFYDNQGVLWVRTPPNYIILLVRFLIKMGLELLVLSDTLDVYSKAFDQARRCARFGEGAISWEVAYGRFNKKDNLVISKRVDEHGPLETRRLYEYEMGCMLPNGECQLVFNYLGHCYACNLSKPSFQEYIGKFKFQMEIGSGLMIPRR